jgi:phage terminase Nu1 subunit (DNA packaging protein)
MTTPGGVEMAELVGSGTIAKLFKCSQSNVRELTAKGIITATKIKNAYKYNMVQATGDYIVHLRGQAAGWSKDEIMRDLEQDKLEADVDLKRARAKRANLEADELEGKLHRAEDVESVQTDLVMAIRSALLSLPGRLAVDITQTKTAKEASARIEKEIHLILSELTGYEYNPAEYRRKVSERSGIAEKDDD